MTCELPRQETDYWVRNHTPTQATIKRRTRLERALNDGQVELAEDIIIPPLIPAGSRKLG